MRSEGLSRKFQLDALILRNSLYGVKAHVKLSLWAFHGLRPHADRTGRQVTDWQAVSRRIRSARESLGWTQERLGAAVGSSANYVAQVEGGLPISEKKLARYGAALSLSLPFLRYGAAQDVDVDTIRREAHTAARREVLTELTAWVTAAWPSGAPAPAAPAAVTTPTPRRQGPSVIQEPSPDTFDQPIPRRKPGQKRA